MVSAQAVATLQQMFIKNDVPMLNDGSIDPLYAKTRCRFCSEKCENANAFCANFSWNYPEGVKLQEGLDE